MTSELVVVTGSRGWRWPGVIRRALIELDAGTVVLHGGAPGADRMAGRACRDLGLACEVMPADWDRLGPGAGFARNTAMLNRGPGLVLAFNLGTPGTTHTVVEARSRGIAVCEFGRDGLLWVSTPRATFGLEFQDGRVVAAPPYARRWTLGHSLRRVLGQVGDADTDWIEGPPPRAPAW